MLTVTILLILITPANTPIQFFSQNQVLATTQEEQDESSSSSNENEESTAEIEASETSQGTTDSEETGGSNGEEENNRELSSSSDQDNECPDASNLSNVPTYIDEDGCVYPCLSLDDDIPEGCPKESPSQTSTGFSINEERPIQPPQNTFTGPFDPSTRLKDNFTLPNREGAVIIDTNPESSFTPGDGQSTSDISSQSNSPDGPLTPGAGNVKRQGSSLEPNALIGQNNPIQSFNPVGQFKPGSGQTELTFPSDSSGLTGPLTPGAGNTQAEGVSTQPNTNPVTPVEPGNIPSKIEDRLAYLTVNIKPNYTDPFEICVLISKPYEVQGNPYCIQTSGGESTMHALQAPGLIDIKALTSKYDIDTSNCEFRIYPQQSKTCVLDVTVNPVIKSKSETTKQDTTLSFNR